MAKKKKGPLSVAHVRVTNAVLLTITIGSKKALDTAEEIWATISSDEK